MIIKIKQKVKMEQEEAPDEMEMWLQATGHPLPQHASQEP